MRSVSRRVKNYPPYLYSTIVRFERPCFEPSVAQKSLYDSTADFTPVALIAEQPFVLIARKDLPANLREFIAYAKANQAKMQYGLAGVDSATHLVCTLFDAAIERHPSSHSARIPQ
jgi:tripartite-type tricarboxylate transporter receptor subunit TctC